MRDCLTILCVGVLFASFIGSLWYYTYPHSVVYACSDKESNPPDVRKMCERLTRGQWWHK